TPVTHPVPTIAAAVVGQFASPDLVLASSGSQLDPRPPTGHSPVVMARPRRGDTIDLTIDDLAFGGEGVGRVDGYVLFARGALPGDRVRVRVTEARARYGRAVIETIEQPSPDRIDAPCPYFGRCGGCRLQHLSYPAQRAFTE